MSSCTEMKVGEVYVCPEGSDSPVSHVTADHVRAYLARLRRRSANARSAAKRAAPPYPGEYVVSHRARLRAFPRLSPSPSASWLIPGTPR